MPGAPRARILTLGVALLVAGMGAAALRAQAKKHTLIVLSHRNHTVYEVDPANGQILHQFVAPDQAHEAAITADGDTIFASVPAAGFVEIIDAATFKEQGRIETDYFKRSPQPRRAGRDGSPPGPPNTSASPHGMALNNDGSRLYIGTENADVSGVVVYDVKARKVLKKIDLLLEGGHYLQIQPGTDKLYYPHRTDNRVVVIDTKTDRIAKIIPVAGGPVGVAFAPNGDVWFHEDGDGSVTVVDSKTDQVTKIIQTGGKGAGRMAVSSDGRFAASPHSDSQDVAIIDAKSKTLLTHHQNRQGPRLPDVLARQHEAVCGGVGQRRRGRDRSEVDGGRCAISDRHRPVRRRHPDRSIAGTNTLLHFHDCARPRAV